VVLELPSGLTRFPRRSSFSPISPALRFKLDWPLEAMFAYRLRSIHTTPSKMWGDGWLSMLALTVVCDCQCEVASEFDDTGSWKRSGSYTLRLNHIWESIWPRPLLAISVTKQPTADNNADVTVQPCSPSPGYSAVILSLLLVRARG